MSDTRPVVWEYGPEEGERSCEERVAYGMGVTTSLSVEVSLLRGMSTGGVAVVVMVVVNARECK